MLALLLVFGALAAWPEDVTIEGMTEHNGLRVVDTDRLADDYFVLVRELGVAIANKPLNPAETLGASGFDFGFSNAFIFTSTSGSEGRPSPWERAHVDEDPASWMVMPGMHARKGLPFSFEAGLNLSWVGMSRTGAFGGYGRLGVIEGYKPLPDLTLHVGYAGYVGNDELEVGTLDLGATLGSTYAFGTFPGIRQAQFSPYLNFSLLRIASTPLVSNEVATTVGAVAYTGKEAMTLPQLAGGFKIVNGTFTLTLMGSYAFPGAEREGSTETQQRVRRGVPSGLLGMGFSY